MKNDVARLISTAVGSAQAAGELRSTTLPPSFAVETPANPSFGDVSSNAALVLARAEGRSPHQIAQTIVRHLRAPAGWLKAEPEIAGPGFINFRFGDVFWQD